MTNTHWGNLYLFAHNCRCLNVEKKKNYTWFHNPVVRSSQSRNTFSWQCPNSHFPPHSICFLSLSITKLTCLHTSALHFHAIIYYYCLILASRQVGGIEETEDFKGKRLSRPQAHPLRWLQDEGGGCFHRWEHLAPLLLIWNLGTVLMKVFQD